MPVFVEEQNSHLSPHDDAGGMIPQHGPGSVRKLNTLNPRKKKQSTSKAHEQAGMVDIDNVQYTENSSNANSVNKSEIMR
jgi:hypothetical protein